VSYEGKNSAIGVQSQGKGARNFAQNCIIMGFEV